MIAVPHLMMQLHGAGEKLQVPAAGHEGAARSILSDANGLSRPAGARTGSAREQSGAAATVHQNLASRLSAVRRGATGVLDAGGTLCGMWSLWGVCSAAPQTLVILLHFTSATHPDTRPTECCNQLPWLNKAEPLPRTAHH